MNRADIEHLASLARMRLTETELEQFAAEIPAIVEYVSAVKEIAEDTDTEPNPGVRPNVFRLDEITNEPNQFSEDILAEMPHSDGRFLSVKKILQTED